MSFFTDTSDPNEHFDLLLENIEIVKERQIAVPFRIIDIKRGGFLIKIEGMYGYVPFDRMPWKYPHPLCWETVYPLLKSESFMGRVFQIEKTMDYSGEGKGFVRIYIDATENVLIKAELSLNEDYKGVVIRKLPYGAIVDIGCHFDWKCGSLTGFLHQSKFFGSRSFHFCEPGQILDVSYIDENEHGLLFATGEYVDFQKYIGKMVRVKVCRDDDGKLAFCTEDGNNAYMPVKTSIYGEKKAWIKKAIKFLTDGEIINCEILEVKKINKLFVLKWLPDDETVNRIDSYFQMTKTYIGKTVPVTICRTEDGGLSFLVENKYNAVMPIEKSIYGGTENMVKYSINHWSDGEIIDCEVLDVDVYTDQFVVKLLFEDFEMFREQEVILSFKIVDIRKGGFLVIIKGLCAFIPFDYMPWNYYQTKSWEAVAAALKGMSFYGKIFRIEKTMDKTGILRIYIDATSSPLEQAELSVNECYEGIVTLKKPYGVFVDIGHHFNWKCGSLPGLLHISKFSDAESFQNCEPGQTITINYLGKNEQGMCFEKEGFVDLYTRFTGKTVQVSISKKIDGSLSFKVEDMYKAIMPVTRPIYGERKDWVLEAVKDWSEGDSIECEVLDVKNFTDVFVVKWLPENDFKKNIGKMVLVKVNRNEDGSMNFVANDRYKAEMPLTKPIYGGQILIVKNVMKYWPDGKILRCEVLDVDFNTESFVVKWLPNKELGSYIGKTIGVKVSLLENGSPELVTDDKHYAYMPVTRAIYDKNMSSVKNAMKSWTSGKIINCEVMNVDPYEQFVVKWLPNKDLIAYIGKTVRVKVCKNEADELDFLVESRYKAEIPLKKSIYNKNYCLAKETMMSWTDGEQIDCEVLEVDVYTEKFIIKCLLKEKIERLPDTELPDINIKVVGKIELKVLNQRIRPQKKSKKQLEREVSE